MTKRACLSAAFILSIWCLSPFFAASAQTPPLTIGSITFDGNNRIDTRRLKNLLRMSREGSLYSPENLKAELQVLEELYQDEGFLRAAVGPAKVEVQTLGANKAAAIRIPISEGPVYNVHEAAIKGAYVIPPETLLQLCPLKKGQPYSRTKTERWQEKIAEAYHDMGYLRFESAVREDLRESSHSVDVTLECTEGKPYSVGKITVIGDESIDQRDIKRRLLLGEGGVYNPEMLSLSIQFLNQMHLYKPISDSDIEIRIDDVKGAVDLILRLTSLRRSGPGS